MRTMTTLWRAALHRLFKIGWFFLRAFSAWGGGGGGLFTPGRRRKQRALLWANSVFQALQPDEPKAFFYDD